MTKLPVCHPDRLDFLRGVSAHSYTPKKGSWRGWGTLTSSSVEVSWEGSAAIHTSHFMVAVGEVQVLCRIRNFWSEL